MPELVFKWLKLYNTSREKQNEENKTKTKLFALLEIQAVSNPHDSSPGQIFNCRKSV